MVDLNRLIIDSVCRVPNFPRQGVSFIDIIPLLADPIKFGVIIDELATHIRMLGCTHIAGIEARGFPLASAIAYKLSLPLVLIRKPNKLPQHAMTEYYEKEYGTDALSVHIGDIKPGDRVAILDDILATGGTARAAIRLVKRCDAEPHFYSIITIDGLLTEPLEVATVHTLAVESVA